MLPAHKEAAGPRTDAPSDPHALLLGGALVFASSVFYALYLIGAGPVIGRPSRRRGCSAQAPISPAFKFSNDRQHHGRPRNR